MARKTFKTGFGPADPSASRQRPHGASRALRRTNLRGGRRTGNVVRAEGFEPPRLASREPKSRASTSSATPASPLRPRDCYVRRARAPPGAQSRAPDGRPRSTPSRKRSITETPNRRRAIRDAHHRGSTARARLCTHGSGRGLYHDGARMQQQNGAIPRAAPSARGRDPRLPPPSRKPLCCIARTGGGRACRPARENQRWKAACPFFSHV